MNERPPSLLRGTNPLSQSLTALTDSPASVLALSVKPYRACQLSQRESLWRNRTLCNSNRKASRYAKASPFGRGGTAQAVTERASLLNSPSLAFARQIPLFVTYGDIFPRLGEVVL